MGGSGSFVCGDFVSESLCRVCRGNRDQEVGLSIALGILTRSPLRFVASASECKDSANEGNGKEKACFFI